jgi:excisionase family DNA binding protein
MINNTVSRTTLSVKLLNTVEAARFLRVSEASIRRWSDAGLLHARRVGPRRERRFSEAELLAFMAPGGPPGSPTAGIPAEITVAGIALPMGAHLATFYTSDAGRLRLAQPLFADGLRAGQPCFLAANGAVLDAYIDALRGTPDIDVEGALRSGLLYTADGPGVGVDDALQFWEQLFWKALAHGPTVLRIVGDMACERKLFTSAAEMMRYELAFSTVAKRFPTVTLCQYDAREFDGPSLLEAIRAHPDLYDQPLGSFLN